MKTFEEAMGILRNGKWFRRKIDILKPLGDEISQSDQAWHFLFELTDCFIEGPITTENKALRLALSAFVAGVAVGREMTETDDTAFTG